MTDIDCNTDAAIAEYGRKVVCLNSATATEELNLRIIGPGDEVIVPCYTYTAPASATIHCGAAVKFVDIKRAAAEQRTIRTAMIYYKNLIKLPLHTRLSDEDVESMCDFEERC